MEQPPERQTLHPVSTALVNLYRDLKSAGKGIRIASVVQPKIYEYGNQVRKKYGPEVLRKTKAFQALIGSPLPPTSKSLPEDFPDPEDSVFKFLADLRAQLFKPRSRE